MNKGLEALYNPKQALNNIRYNYFESKREEDIDIEHFWFDTIEKELKDYEQLKEDYEILKESYDAQCFSKDTIDNLRTLCDKLQKVLGIIKSKYVDLWLLSHFKSWNAYQNAHMNCSKTPLTKEEYELVCRWFYDK